MSALGEGEGSASCSVRCTSREVASIQRIRGWMTGGADLDKKKSNACQEL